MNAALAPTTADATQDAPATFDRVPQVNLLPADVAAAHGLRAVKRWILLGLALVVLTLGLVYLTFSMANSDARADLNAARDEATRLAAEQARYAEVPVVLGELADVKATRELATASEVLWRPYIEAITAALPEGGELRTLQATGATPVSPAAPPGDVLQQQAVGQLTLTALSATVPNVADWNDALGAVPGLIDARVQTVAQESGAPGSEEVGGYVVTMTMQYDETALAGRFVPTEEN